MAKPLQTGKRSVKLGAPVRASRIRRDPPPVVKKVAVRDPEAREAWTVVIGVVSFALALFAIVIGFSSYDGGSPSDYTINATNL